MARTPKKLAHGYLTTSLAVLYTVPASTRTQITEVWIANTDAGLSKDITLTVGDSTLAKNAIASAVTVNNADTVVLSDCKITLTASETFGGRINTNTTGTATGGASASITLSTASSTIDDYYNNSIIELTNNSPNGVLGLSKIITDYTGSSKVAIVDSNWATLPVSAATTYIIGPTYVTLFGIEEGI